MPLNPSINLSFDGRCEEAFRFYESCLNGKITFMLKWADSPMAKDAPPGWADKIVHATLAVNDLRIQGSDPAPAQYDPPRGFTINLHPDIAEADRLFQQLAEGGTVLMPLQQTFWAQKFGVVTDRFGVPWVINCEQSE